MHDKSRKEMPHAKVQRR